MQPGAVLYPDPNAPAVPAGLTDATSRAVKRTLDVIVSLGALALLLPLCLGIGVFVAAASPGPVFFRQVRVGRHGRHFTMFKFRTMVTGGDDTRHRELVARELDGTADPTDNGGLYKLTRDPRITPGSRLLRRLSLDELPQLLNVLLGHMSIVGPRPSLPWEVELYPAHHRRERHLVRPGLTGLWQVSGRNRLSALEMLELDVRYVRTRSTRQDLAILLRTVPAVLRGDAG